MSGLILQSKIYLTVLLMYAVFFKYRFKLILTTNISQVFDYLSKEYIKCSSYALYSIFQLEKTAYEFFIYTVVLIQ